MACELPEKMGFARLEMKMTQTLSGAIFLTADGAIAVEQDCPEGSKLVSLVHTNVEGLSAFGRCQLVPAHATKWFSGSNTLQIAAFTVARKGNVLRLRVEP